MFLVLKYLYSSKNTNNAIKFISIKIEKLILVLNLTFNQEPDVFIIGLNDKVFGII